MIFDPASSTLYFDSHLANSLHLDDGTSVELPTDVLMNSINSGQVQVLNNKRSDLGANAMAFKAHLTNFSQEEKAKHISHDRRR